MKQLFTLLSFFVFNGLLFTSTVWAQAGANDPTFNTFDDGTYGDGSGANNEVLPFRWTVIGVLLMVVVV
jgi:hypothetical protein